jgi:4-aminobutyrate aminotransferase/(S)-3-amino-2-methylpropionate transaminase
VSLRCTFFYFYNPGKVLLLEAVLETMKKDKLLDNVNQTGEVLLGGLKELQQKYPGVVNSARGLGTFCSIDADTPERYA